MLIFIIFWTLMTKCGIKTWGGIKNKPMKQMKTSFLRKQQVRKENNNNICVIFNDRGHFCGRNQPSHPSGAPAVGAWIWRYFWWGRCKRPVAALFRSLFYFLTVSPLNWGNGGAGRPAVPLQPSGCAPDGPQRRRPIYLWPRLNEGMLAECWDTATARLACLASFNKPQLWRSTESVITREVDLAEGSDETNDEGLMVCIC